LLCLTAALQISVARADRYELLVYSDDLPGKGESEFEELLSVAKPRDISAFPGPTVWQSHTEVNYGLGKGWEIGVEGHATASGTSRKFGGLAVEVEYVDEHDEARGFYWGIRADIGRQASYYEDDWGSAIDVNPILGYRNSGFHLVLNPSLEVPLGGAKSSLSLQPSAKAAWQIPDRSEVGFEYFGDWGSLRQQFSSPQRNQTLYLVWDGQGTWGHFNVGMGKSIRTSAGTPDNWVLKLGVQVELD